MRALHRVAAALSGKNTAFTPKNVIRDQMLEPRPLPMGRQEFEEWSDRLIAGAMCPAQPRSQKKALAEMILHVNPAESHVADAYFIHRLRNAAAREVGFAIMQEIQAAQKAEFEAAQLSAKTAESQPLS